MFYYVAHFYNLNVLGPRRDEGGRDDGAAGERPEERQQPENFNLKHQLNRQYFPCRFIKVVPIQSWGPSFNFSIWHIALWGDDNPEVVKTALDWQHRFREEDTIQPCARASTDNTIT